MKQKNLQITNLFCGILIAVCLCFGFYVYGQNHENKSTTPNAVDNPNQTNQITTDIPKNTTNDENKNDAVVAVDNVDAVVDGEVDNSDQSQTVFYRIGLNITELPEVLISHFNAAINDDDNDKTDSTNKTAQIKRRRMIYVAEVVPNSPAEKSGIKQGDIILKFGGKKIDSPDALIKQVNAAKNTEQNLVIIRNNKKIDVKITPEKFTRNKSLNEIIPQEQDFKLLPHRHFKWGDRKRLIEELEEKFSQLKEDAGVDLFFSFPDDNNLLPPNINLPNITLPNLTSPNLNNLKNIQNGESKSLSITTQKDANGKTKIKVNKTTNINGKTEENTWETENIDQLPDEIKNEVKQFFETKKLSNH
ncbi:MAG: PDZ domain-containing protein [Planctomycetaceae bacterium]|nr:PDZ domain-containing protein [Planctomycetaceae bacterium]